MTRNSGCKVLLSLACGPAYDRHMLRCQPNVQGCHILWPTEKQTYFTRNIRPPTGGFFLAPAEGCSLWLPQKGSSGPKVILADWRMNREAGGNGFKGVRFIGTVVQMAWWPVGLLDKDGDSGNAVYAYFLQIGNFFGFACGFFAGLWMFLLVFTSFITFFLFIFFGNFF